MLAELQKLKVYELEPKHKHSTIFEWFDKLQSGESFIIENDHDPIPLYYELEAERRNELDGFEYLQKGPEIWIVQISKSVKSEQQYDACSIQKTPGKRSEGSEPSYDSCSIKKEEPDYNSCSINTRAASSEELKVLDVTKLAPKHKHPTIFEWFYALQPGESFTIKNDHDPKPLYYQMLGELGQVFKWEYKEQGPQWWQVVIQKNLADEPTVGELAAKDIRKAEAMKKMGIDFCCGGGKTISQAAMEAGITTEELTMTLAAAENNNTSINNSFDKWDADFLADYIYNQHHKYFYENREDILQLVAKVMQVHSQDHPKFIKLVYFVDKLFHDLKTHFYKEEKILFPYIKELVVYKKRAIQPLNQLSIAQGPLAMMHSEHEAAGEMLKTIRELTNDYQPHANACNSIRLLYDKLKDLESDLHQHIHLENNILFPKALQLEKDLLD